MLSNKGNKRNRQCIMTTSEIITIFMYYHQSQFRTFNYYYIALIQRCYTGYLPDLLLYTLLSFINFIIVPLCAFMHSLIGENIVLYFMDSTLLKACHIKREKHHKVFDSLAQKSKSSMGWFVGLKLQ